MEECPKEGFINYQNPKVKREQEYYGNSLEDIEYQTRRVEWSQALVEITEKCEMCGDVVVDLATGMFHCGLRVPDEVKASNQSINED
jgi:hypothetical protein